MRLTSVLVAVAALALTACAGDEGGGVDLGDHGPVAPVPDGDADAQATAPDGDDDQAADPPATDPPAGDAAAPGPGTWRIGDAGSLTFGVADGRLVLDDVTAASGWSAETKKDEDDALEIEFRDGDDRWRFAAELDDADLEIVLEGRMQDVPAGTFELGDAGALTVAVRDGELVVDDLTLADGWTVEDRDEDDDQVQLELLADGRTFELELKLKGDRLELDTRYEVIGRV